MKHALYVVLLTALTHVTVGASRLNVSLSAYHLHASPATIGLLMGLFGLIGIVLAVPAGRLVARHGTRAVMLTGPVLVACASAAGGLWHSLPALVVVSLLTGIGWSVFYVGGQTMLGQTPDRNQRMINYTLSGTAFGTTNFVGPMLAGFAIDHFGDAQSFLIFTALPLITALVFAFGPIPFVRPGAADPSMGSPPLPPGPADDKRGHTLDLLRLPAFRSVFLVAGAAQIATYGWMFLAPILGARFGWSASTIGLLMGTFAIAQLAIRGTSAWLAKRFTPWRLILLALAAMAIGMAGAPFTDRFVLQALCGILVGAASGLTSPVLIVRMHEAVPQNRIADVVGLRVTQLYSTQASAPLIAGPLAALLGIGGAFWLAAALLGATIWAVRSKWHQTEGS